MLYLDSSVLVKRYVQEAGSKAVASRFETGEAIYTSVLSFAEVHAAFGRKYRQKEISVTVKQKLVNDFLDDWLFGLSTLEVSTATMSAIPNLCEQYLLRASDAIHLSAALWLKDRFRFHAKDGESIVEFGASDRQLGEAARKCGFNVFNLRKSKANFLILLHLWRPFQRS